MDVADLNGGQLAEDHRGRHRTWLGGGVLALLIGFVNQRQQAGFFGEVVERLPQGVGQHAHKDVRLGTARNNDARSAATVVHF